MPAIVTVVGYSDSGKTTVAASLVEQLASLGHRVAAVKHAPHGHDVDRRGSDTDRLFDAGAVVAVASSPGKRTLVERVDGDPSLESVVATLPVDVDVVVAEGFKTSEFPKVLVVEEGSPPPTVDNVIATVARSTGEWTGYRGLEGLAEKIRDELIGGD